MKKTLEDFLCIHCVKTQTQNFRPAMKNIVVTKMRERVTFDLTEFKPHYDGYKYLFVLVDNFTKRVWTFRLKNKRGIDILEVLQNNFEGISFEFWQSDNVIFPLFILSVI